MGVISKLKEKAGKLFLSGKGSSGRLRRGYGLQNAEKILIVYRDEDEARYKRLKKLFRDMKEEHDLKLVRGIAFIDAGEKEVPVYHAHKLEMDYLTREDLSWNAKASQHMRSLLREDFHILIDIAETRHPVLDYFISHSQSAMKVGREGSSRSAEYDFRVSAPDSFSPEVFFNQVKDLLANLKIE